MWLNVTHIKQLLWQDGPKAGIAKGLRTVVEERFGEEAVKGRPFACLCVFGGKLRRGWGVLARNFLIR